MGIERHHPVGSYLRHKHRRQPAQPLQEIRSKSSLSARVKPPDDSVGACHHPLVNVARIATAAANWGGVRG